MQTLVQAATSGVALGALASTLVLGITTQKQQDTIEQLIEIDALASEYDMQQQAKLWDLHRRMLALEAEDQRIMAHVKWFVMRRSGTAELARMERAIERLEAQREAGE